jgi:hypothetical protein
MEFFQAGHINDNVGFRRVSLGVIFFSCADNQVDNIGKASAAAAPLFHGMIHFDRNDQLPTILIQQLDDRVADFPIRNVIAATNQHSQTARKDEHWYPLF